MPQPHWHLNPNLVSALHGRFSASRLTCSFQSLMSTDATRSSAGDVTQNRALTVGQVWFPVNSTKVKASPSLPTRRRTGVLPRAEGVLLPQRRLPALIDIELELVPIDDCSERGELLFCSVDE